MPPFTTENRFLTAPQHARAGRLSRLARDVRTVPAAELHVHLINGSAARFVQPDVAEAARLVERIQPQRLFREPQITLADARSSTTFPSDAVEQVTLLADTAAPGWPLPEGVADVVELSSESMLAEDVAAAAGIPPNTVADDVSYGEIELRSGRVLYLRVTLANPPQNPSARVLPLDLRIAFLHLFQQGVILGRRSEGGTFLLNPRNLLRFTTYPASPVSGIAAAVPAAARFDANPGALPAGYYCG